jgi:hypothetical protein
MKYLITILTVCAAAGCDSLVEVPAPSRVLADGLAVPSNAALLTNSVGADLECALANYAAAGGLTGNELEVATGGIVIKEYDKRDFKTFGSSYSESTCESAGNPGVYKPLSTARFQADNVLGLLQEWSDQEVPERQQKIAAVAAYGGYAYLLMGEAMCSAAFDLGPELAPAQIWALAEERYTTAITAAQQANAPDLVALGMVGRARARMRLGHTADADADAKGVPAGFRFDATYSGDSQRRYNTVWSMLEQFQEVSVDSTYMHVEFGGVPDPRVAAFDVGKKATNGVTELWSTHKYPGNDAPIPLATWEEAQLIIAEVEGGQVAVDIINALHDKAGLPHFNSADPAAILAQVVEERKRQFFLDGHHLGDLKQYHIPLSPPEGAPFRDGGGTYQGQTCFPLPDNERLNNPNLNH